MREQGEDGKEGGNKGREGWRGGREEAMMIGRERASVEEGRVEGGWVDEGNERGRDGTRHGQRKGKMVGRKRAGEGLSEAWREGASEGRKLQGRYPEEGTGQCTVYYSQTIPQRGPWR